MGSEEHCTCKDPRLINKLKDNTTSKAAVLCLNTLRFGGPSRIDPLFAIVPIKSIKNSLRGPPPSTAGSPRKLTRRCFFSSKPEQSVTSESSNMCPRRTVIRNVSKTSVDKVGT